MTTFLPIAGTHGYSGALSGSWWVAGSPWLSMMERDHQCVPYAPDRPYVWSTSLDGFRLWPFGGHVKRAWAAAGWNLWQYLVPVHRGGGDNGVGIPADETRIVCHSHGLQAVLYACSFGLKVRSLISVGSPVRKDTHAVAIEARKHIQSWTHIHHKGFDWWAFSGALTDGHWGYTQKQPLADYEIAIPDVGHTGLVNDVEHFDHWDSLVPYLKG